VRVFCALVCVCVCVGCVQTMHAGVALQYIECQVITLAPVCPHVCDYVWREVLGHSQSVFKTQWPTLPAPDRDILDSKYAVEVTKLSSPLAHHPSPCPLLSGP
jgi:isoleucyl-tRNA synthetase